MLNSENEKEWIFQNRRQDEWYFVCVPSFSCREHIEALSFVQIKILKINHLLHVFWKVIWSQQYPMLSYADFFYF